MHHIVKAEVHAEVSALDAKVGALDTKVDALQAECDTTLAEKNRRQEAADTTARRLRTADKLTAGLADEATRWSATAQSLTEQLGGLADIEARLLAGEDPPQKQFELVLTPFCICMLASMVVGSHVLRSVLRK